MQAKDVLTRLLAALPAGLLLLAGSAATAADYWPVAEGLTWDYRDASGNTFVVRIEAPIGFPLTRVLTQGPFYMEGEQYLEQEGVSGPEQVTVPAGTFTVMRLVEFPLGANCGREYGEYYLHRDIGPVVLPGGYELVSWSGVVEATGATWGAVKGLYR